MVHFVILCLFISLSAYLLLAGADFGAGILELFSRPEKRAHLQRVTYKAIGPIWEANHIWLVLAIVILFVGFPQTHTLLTTYMHIPLLLLLVGIIFRGTAFVFKHYDAFRDDTQGIYDLVFRYSSLFAPFFLGVTAGALLGGKIPSDPSDFFDAFLGPWLNPFALSVGALTVSICAFLAAIYLIGEEDDENHVIRFTRIGQIANLGVILIGGLVLLTAPATFLNSFFNGWGIAALVLAGLGVVGLWYLLGKRKFILARIVAGAQVILIFGAAFAFQYPMQLAGLDLYGTAAEGATLTVLGWCLVAGLALIGPALGFLFRVFKSD